MHELLNFYKNNKTRKKFKVIIKISTITQSHLYPDYLNYFGMSFSMKTLFVQDS